MCKRFLAILTVLVFLVPSIVWAGASQYQGSKKTSATVSQKSMKGAPPEKVNEHENVMEKTARHKNVTKNKQVMERNIANEKQGHKIVTGTVNE